MDAHYPAADREREDDGLELGWWHRGLHAISFVFLLIGVASLSHAKAIEAPLVKG